MTEGAPALRTFGEADGDLSTLSGRRIAFIGYGNQGRAQALNLRDSVGAAGVPCEMRVATLRDGTWKQAEADGFAVGAVEEAAREADVLFMLIPDEDLPEVMASEIAPGLEANDALVIASGYNLAYEEITPPENVDIVMVAPRMIGEKVRERYEQGAGFYSYVSVEQDASGRAWPLVLALAKGMGALRQGAIELSAKDETLIDLFMEQGFGALLGITVYQTLEVGAQAGLPPEALILELYLSGEMAGTFEAMAEHGFAGQARLHSRTSQYGGMTRSMRVDREALRKHLEQALEEIRDGTFAREWAAERAAKGENFEKLRSLAAQANPFSPIEERLRKALERSQGDG